MSREDTSREDTGREGTGREPTRRRRPRREVSIRVWQLASVVLFLGIWAAASHLRGDLSLPGPLAVADALVEKVSDGTLLSNAWASAFRVLAGFAIAVCMAVPVGFLMGWYRPVRGLLEPAVQFLRTVPPIAMIPVVIVILKLGIDEQAKIFVIWLSAFLTIVVAVYQGVRNVDPTLIQAARVLGARDRVLFLDVVVPASLPYLLVGMRLGVGASWSTLVAAELISSDHRTGGLGAMVQEAATYLDSPVILLGVLTIGCLGLAMDRGVLWLERRLTAWQERVER